jgi:hypothetical protein
MITNGEELAKKINDLKADNKYDLAQGEDLSVALMNLISLEEHFFFTYQKTKEDRYLEMLNEMRLMRTQLMKDIVKNPGGEVWCISKHLLATSMRLNEVGTKQLKKEEISNAKDSFQKAYDLYSLFWALNLDVVNVSDVKKDNQEENEINLIEEKKESIDSKNIVDVKQKRTGLFAKIGDLVQKAIDCCKE